MNTAPNTDNDTKPGPALAAPKLDGVKKAVRRAPFSELTLTVIAVTVSLVVAAFGALAFYGRYAYAEPGSNMILMGHLALCFVLFLGLRLWKLSWVAVGLVLIVGLQIYGSQKFAWREAYVVAARSGKPFVLSEYIEQYPTYEEYLLAFTGDPDWVRFARQCVEPALANDRVGAHCNSLESIQDKYNIDISAVMRLHLGKMRNTAKMVQENKLNKRSAYAACLTGRSCAKIPLLPRGVDANKIDPSSREYIDVRQAFWSLLNDKTMSKETCMLTPLCQALVNMRAVDPAKLPF